MSTSSGSSGPCGTPLPVVEEAPEVGRNGGLLDGSTVCHLVSVEEATDEIYEQPKVSVRELTRLSGTAAE